MGKSLRAQPFDDSILGIGIKIGIDGGSRLVLISHSMSAPVSASTTHKKISASSSKKWVPSQACNICLINCLMLFSTSRMTVHQKLMDNFHFAFGIGRPKNIQHNPPGPSVDMENICSTNLMWEVRSIFLEYQVYVINLAYSGATDNRCANFSASVEYRARSVTPAPHHRFCKRITTSSYAAFDVPPSHCPFRGTPSRVR